MVRNNTSTKKSLLRRHTANVFVFSSNIPYFCKYWPTWSLEWKGMESSIAFRILNFSGPSIPERILLPSSINYLLYGGISKIDIFKIRSFRCVILRWPHWVTATSFSKYSPMVRIKNVRLMSLSQSYLSLLAPLRPWSRGFCASFDICSVWSVELTQLPCGWDIYNNVSDIWFTDWK